MNLKNELSERAQKHDAATRLLEQAGYGDDEISEREYLEALEAVDVQPRQAASTRRLERLSAAFRSGAEFSNEATREAVRLYADEVLVVRGMVCPTLEEYLDAIATAEIALGIRP